MKVLQVVTRRYRRGSEVFATTLSDALVRRGHDVELVALHAPGPSPLVPEATSYRDLGGGIHGKLDPALVTRLVRHIRRARPDVVQANGSDTLKYTALAKKLSLGQWSLVYRNVSIASQWVRSPAQRAWIRWLLRSVDHVASVGEGARRDMIQTYRLSAARVSTIRGGVDTSAVYPRAEARAHLLELLKIPPHACVLAHVGSFTPEKNHRELLEAFAEISRAREQTHLCLVGDGALRAEVEQLIVTRSLASQVHVLGTRSDVNHLLAGADLMILTSTIEGIPGVVLEAAIQGVPTVSSDVGDVREVVEHGKTGLLVPSGDTPAMVRAVLRLIDGPAERRAMGEAARELVCRHHDLNRIAFEFEQVYQRSIYPRSRDARCLNKFACFI